MADLSALKIAAAVTRRRTAVFFLQAPANTGVRVGPWLKRGGNLNGVIFGAGHRAFIVVGASEAEVRTAIAIDPRVHYISAGFERNNSLHRLDKSNRRTGTSVRPHRLGRPRTRHWMDAQLG
jgi:hypothetical protein